MTKTHAVVHPAQQRIVKLIQRIEMIRNRGLMKVGLLIGPTSVKYQDISQVRVQLSKPTGQLVEITRLITDAIVIPSHKAFYYGLKSKMRYSINKFHISDIIHCKLDNKMTKENETIELLSY